MTNKRDLTFPERICAVLLYLALLLGALWYASGDFGQLLAAGTPYNQLLLSGGLLLIFGAYIAETYFTKPTDVLVNATGILLFVLGIEEHTTFIGRDFFLVCALFLIAASILVIFLLQRGPSKYLDGAVRLLVLVGQSRVAFSAIYLATLVTYFQNDTRAFAALLSFWAIFISGFVVEYCVHFLFRLRSTLSEKTNYVGSVTALENACVYKVERDMARETTAIEFGDLVRVDTENGGKYGLVVHISPLVGKEWVNIYLLEAHGETGGLNGTASVRKNLDVYKVDINTLPIETKTALETNPVFRNRKCIVGYVYPDSDISRIKFRVFANANSHRMSEGVIVSVHFGGQSVLFQTYDAYTKAEELEGRGGDTYLLALARKLGTYDRTHREIATAKWLPEMYVPVYILEDTGGPRTTTDIGELPGTDYPIRIENYHHLVTHNAAILGILGIGKSCLTFELIQKVVANTTTKVICLDITGQYSTHEDGLPRYIQPEQMVIDLVERIKVAMKDSKPTVADNKEDGGTKAEVGRFLKEGIQEFMLSDTARVLIINPEEVSAFRQDDAPKPRPKKDEHGKEMVDERGKVTAWEQHAPFSELSVAEITRLVSEIALGVCKSEGLQRDARMLLVYEEAHSLIPEWNSAANDGDKAAANGTARVILQGRKYGLGSFVVTQRTANISKSILNQCNTIFAMRVFDDTGKQFLENYVGTDYANLLPTLEDRHAVVIGKGLKLKQPVIIKLNDRDLVMLPSVTERPAVIPARVVAT